MLLQNLRFKPKKTNKKIALLLERQTKKGAWVQIGIMQPRISLAGYETLKLDIFSPQIYWQDAEKKGKKIVLTGKDGIAKIKTIVKQHSADILRVETNISFSKPILVEKAVDELKFTNFKVEKIWLPHQAPLKDMLVGDLAFKSAALIIQNSDEVLSIIPNYIKKQVRRVPFAARIDTDESKIFYGCVPYHLSKNTYFAHYATETHTDSMAVPRSTISYCYYIYFKNNCKENEGYREVTKRITRLYNSTWTNNTETQKITFDKYNKYAADYLNKKLFQNNKLIPIHIELKNAIAIALHSKKNAINANPKVKNVIDLALSSPVKNGLFKVLYANGEWKCGSTFSNLPKNLADESIRLADLSATCYYLCRYYNEIEKSDKIFAFVKSYADRLVKLQKSGGYIPAWLPYNFGKAKAFCARSAENAEHIIFLTELLKITNEKKYESCARRLANFIINKIFKIAKWEDTNLFCSSSPMWEFKKPGMKINSSYAVSVNSIINAANSLIKLYKITRTPRHLYCGEKIIDYLSLYQLSYQPKYLTIPAIGSFAVMDTDIHHFNFMQAEAAETYLECYKLTGKSDYFTRGIAALRATFELMCCTENTELNLYIKNQKENGYIFPYCFPSVKGKNITFPEHDDYNIAVGTALLITEKILDEFGDLFVDTKRKKAFGINGIIVENVYHDLAGISISGNDFLDEKRVVNVKTDTGDTFSAKINKNKKFEILV